MRKCFEGLLWKHINRLSRKPNALIRNRFLREYRNASDESRNKRNAETYYVLKAFAEHNDAEAIKEIYRIGYPGLRDADDIWTEASLPGIAAENQNYEALQALADSGVDVSWYGGYLDKFNWMFVIANKDIRMCRIIATAKNRMITEEAAAFIAEFCPELVPELVHRADGYEKDVWCSILGLIDKRLVINESESKVFSLQDRVETLALILRYDEVLDNAKENLQAINAMEVWRCIFPEVMSDSYSHDYFYSDAVNEPRNRLIKFLLDNNLFPDSKVVENMIYSSRRWWPRENSSQKNYLSTLTDLLNWCSPIYARALLDALWWTHDITLTKHLLLNGPSNMRSNGLLHLMVDFSLYGDWPKVITTPLGRAIRHDLWQRFSEEHDSYINEVIDVMKYLHRVGNLSINEQNEEHKMTALHLLFREALPQSLHMLCIKKLLVTMIELGADVNIIDNYGKTAYDYATAKKAPKSVLKLLQAKK